MSLGLKIKYLINDSYNAWYVNTRNIPDNNVMLVSDFQNQNSSKIYAAPFATVWLLNIKRIIKASGLINNLNEYDFLDVGCGKAISSIYVKEMYNFKSVSGFDFENALLEVAKNNIKNASLKNNKVSNISLFQADASDIILPEKKYFIYMFNPFSEAIMTAFIKKNVEMFKRTNSVIGYANCRELEAIRSFGPKDVKDVVGYKCAVLFF